MADREELERQANEKLAAAWRLIEEAGALAKEGQFPLHFGEVGDFIPRSFLDRDLLREQALENLRRDGRYNGHDRVLNPTLSAERGYEVYDYPSLPSTPFDQIPPDELEAAIEAEIEGIQDSMEIPYEFKEYGRSYAERNVDRWWRPSRC